MLTQKVPKNLPFQLTLLFPPSLNQTYRPSTGNAWPTWHRKLANMFNVMSFSEAETAGAPTSSKVSKAVPICQSWWQIRTVRAIVERLDEVCTCLAVQTSESVKTLLRQEHSAPHGIKWFEISRFYMEDTQTQDLLASTLLQSDIWLPKPFISSDDDKTMQPGGNRKCFNL